MRCQPSIRTTIAPKAAVTTGAQGRAAKTWTKEVAAGPGRGGGRLFLHPVARQGDPGCGLGQGDGRASGAEHPHALRRQAHVLGRLPPDPRHSGGVGTMANPAGSFIWYELMTPDPAGSKRFYDAVVAGWTIEAQPSGDMDYRMITRSDGGNSGGVLRLTEEMQGHGARPCWLGYLGVLDVDGAVARVEEDGGRGLMPGHDIRGGDAEPGPRLSGSGAHPHGDRPRRRAFLPDDPARARRSA